MSAYDPKRTEHGRRIAETLSLNKLIDWVWQPDALAWGEARRIKANVAKQPGAVAEEIACGKTARLTAHRQSGVFRSIDNQASSGRWMSLKLPTLLASNLSMILRHTTHLAVSPSLLGTSEGVAE
ncbi:MAG: hypothetical protein WAK55_01595 [Xanthobacteraceae bacterium]